MIGETAALLLQGLNEQLPPSGFHLKGIEVRVGELVDVNPELLRASLCAMLPGVEVVITRVLGLLKCDDCGAEFPHDEHPCPACGSARATLMHGTEFDIVRAWGSTDGAS